MALRAIRMVIDSELSNVSLMAVAVNRICSQLGMDDVLSFQMELCVSEAATNSIRHAYGGRSGHEVSLLLSVEAERLILECSDTGKPMGPEQVQRLTRGCEIRDHQEGHLPEGGRGLQIMHDLMDQVCYLQDGRFNRLQMCKQFRGSDSPSVSS